MVIFGIGTFNNNQLFGLDQQELIMGDESDILTFLFSTSRVNTCRIVYQSVFSQLDVAIGF